MTASFQPRRWRQSCGPTTDVHERFDRQYRIGATVVFAKLDRLTRNVDLLRTLVARGVDLVFCDLPHVPAGAMGRFLLTQMASVAELEAGLISERTKAALAAAKALGVRQDDGARRRRLSVLSVAQFVGRRKRPANWDGGGANTTA